MYKIGMVDKGLQELYGYPKYLSPREAYKTAWHLARLINYQREVFKVPFAWASTEYLHTCASYGINNILALVVWGQFFSR